MPYKLNDSQIREMVTQPETGPGYQYVEATMNDRSILKGVVVNAEVFIPENKIGKVIGVRHLTYSAILNEAERPGYILNLEIIQKKYLELGENKHFSKSGKPAVESPVLYTSKNQYFKRFSPYRNDRRVLSDGRLLPGTYATTAEDAANVKTGIEATLRYALPSDDPAIHVFQIFPPEKISMRMGIVEPANGKPGGGVEVLFDNGCPRDTVKGKEVIPAT